MTIEISRVLTPKDMDSCLAIRYQVFVIGQQVPHDEEVDGLDDICHHYILKSDTDPAGTTRVRFIDHVAKIERVAVLDSHQGKGYGKQIMEFILADLRLNSKVSSVKLSSQVHAIPFYEKLGFQVCSDEYLDASIPHKDMVLELN